MPLVAIIDIGSASVGGALIDSTRNKKSNLLCSKILYSTRNEITFNDELDIPRFIKGIEKVIEKTIADLMATKRGNPGEIICFLSAPFYAAQTRSSINTYPKPISITPKLVTGLVGAELNRFKDSQPHPEHEVSESKLLQVKLNGYVTDQPYGQRAERVELAVYCSIGTGKHLARFREILSGGFHQSKITFHSFSLALYSTLHELSPLSNMLLIDIGGEITELTLVWRGVLWESGTFALGRNFLVREITREFGTTLQEAGSTLRLYLAGTQTKKARNITESILIKVAERWRAEFKTALQTMLVDCFLPENISLIFFLDLGFIMFRLPRFRNGR